jgi:hypothetical protein
MESENIVTKPKGGFKQIKEAGDAILKRRDSIDWVHTLCLPIDLCASLCDIFGSDPRNST